MYNMGKIPMLEILSRARVVGSPTIHRQSASGATLHRPGFIKTSGRANSFQRVIDCALSIINGPQQTYCFAKGIHTVAIPFHFEE